MTNPQKENGFVPIANEIMEALASLGFPMSHYEWKLLMFIFRKTYGWSKKEDKISISQFVIGTNIRAPHVCRAIKRMVKRNIITQIGNGYSVTYSFQKNSNKWKLLPKQVILPKQVLELPKQVIGITQTGNKLLPKQGDTIYNTTDTTKDTKQKTGETLPKQVTTKKQNPFEFCPPKGKLMDDFINEQQKGRKKK